MGNDRLQRLGVAAAAGLLGGLALPPLGLPPLLWVALALLWHLAASVEPRLPAPPSRAALLTGRWRRRDCCGG